MTRFYFVHSYYVDAVDRSLLAGTCSTGSVPMPRWRGTTCLPCSFTRKKAIRRGCNCYVIFWSGTANADNSRD